MPVPRPSDTRFTGLSGIIDTRIHAVRPDVADRALFGIVDVPRFVEPVLRQCQVPWAALRDAGSDQANQTSELLSGDGFMLIDEQDGWAWGFCAHDHYVGYVAATALGPVSLTSVHQGSDPVSTAQTFLGMPYVWGGRGGAGIDCSGLIQRSWAAKGIMAPRDSDMQAATFGTLLSPDMPLDRSDLVFFPGHVGMMVSDVDMIHATRHFEKVVVEPLADVIARVATKYDDPVTARKRVCS